jgi:hypothetical protein
MKLYEFKTTKYGEPKLGYEEYDVEEKPKTYISKYRRFNKEDMGRVIGYGYDTVLLLENNPAVAAQILIGQKRIEYQK